MIAPCLCAPDGPIRALDPLGAVQDALAAGDAMAVAIRRGEAPPAAADAWQATAAELAEALLVLRFLDGLPPHPGPIAQ